MLDTPLNDLDPQAFRQLLLSQQIDEQTLPESRARMDLRGLASPLPAGCQLDMLSLGELPAEQLTPRNAREGRLLIYFHGGGFQLGSPRSIRHLAAQVAGAAGVATLVPEYRLAPEDPFPAAVEDAVTAYRWALERSDSERIAFAGDSAGGGLAVAAALAARDQGLPQPRAIYAISPWIDLAEGGPSYEAKAESDIFCSVPGLQAMAAAYLAGADARDPLASPLFADFNGLASLLIQVGSEEVLLSDSIRLAERAALAKVKVRLEVFPEMLHAFPMFHEHLSAARKAIREAGDWLAQRLD